MAGRKTKKEKDFEELCKWAGFFVLMFDNPQPVLNLIKSMDSVYRIYTDAFFPKEEEKQNESK